MTNDEVQLDFRRSERIGFDEAILCAGKSREQLQTILTQVDQRQTSCLMTRLEPEAAAVLSGHWHTKLDYDATSRTAFFNWQARQPVVGNVAVVTAGSTDMPVAREALRTLEYYNIGARAFVDVGVAGLWRLLDRVEELKTFPVTIAIAGMDGALPTVLGGLLPGMVIAVPTSTGYGAAQAGQTALNAALASCAPGLCVVNIDNGYGAACAATRMVNLT